MLPAFLRKSADERAELRTLNADAGKEAATILINPSDTSAPPDIAPVKQRPSPQHQYYHQPERKASRSFFSLLPIAIILGLIVAVLNKDRLAAFFDGLERKDKPVATATTKKKTTKPKPAEKQSTDTNLADTIISKGDDGSTDQVIIGADPAQRENEMKSFVRDFYIDRGNCTNLSRYFGSVAKQYYSKTDVSLSDIKKDCESYHSRWKFTEAKIDDDSFVFTHSDNGKLYIDFSMLFNRKQNEADEWVPYSIDVSMIVDSNNKIERIVERRIEKL